VVERNYPPEAENKDLLRPQNESQSIVDGPTTVNLSTTDEFSYYTVADRESVVVELNYWIQAFLFKLVPCVLLSVLTVMLIIVMHQANRRRMKLKSQVASYRRPVLNIAFVTILWY